jgi:DNA-nicking Smr family endonuclease
MGRKNKQGLKQLTAEEAKTGVVFESDQDANKLLKEYLDSADAGNEDLLTAKGIVDEVEVKKDFSSKGKSPSKKSLSKKSLSKKSLSKKGLRSGIIIDLHGLTLEEAKSRVKGDIADAFSVVGKYQEKYLVEAKIITGKGKHSSSTSNKSYEIGILAKEIHGFVRSAYKNRIVQIGESPADLLVNGLPVRGHFTVIISN